MANWRKVLVSGSNIEVNQISGSSLNLSAFSAAAEENKVLIVGTSGSITTIAQNSLLGAEQSFRIGQQTPTDIAPITFDTSDILLFKTGSVHGFSFTVTDNVGAAGTSSVTLNTPQDLQTTATPTFANLQLGTNESVGGTIRAGAAGSSNPSAIVLDVDNLGITVGGNTILATGVSNVGDPTEQTSISIGSDTNTASQTFRVTNGHPDNDGFVGNNLQTGELSTHLIFTSGSRVGIGVNVSSLGNATHSPTAKLHISGGDVFIEKGAISASLPTVTGTPGLVSYDTASGGFRFISSSDFLATIATQISGAFAAASESINESIGDNTTAIEGLSIPNITALETSASKGIRFQAIQGTGSGDEGRSIPLTETASFIGSTNEIIISHSQVHVSESVFEIGLPDNVTIAGNLTVNDSISVTNDITATDITASGNISASGDLTVTGDVTLDGTLSFSGLSFIQNQAAVLSGSTVFGSGSLPSENTHQFTGSLLVTGSQIELVGGDINLENGNLNVDQGGITVTTGDITITAGDLITNEITASGAISASGDLFANLTEQNHPDLVVYDTDTGQFFRTASSAIQGTNTIGAASDGLHDGLLNFNEDTLTGDAVDLINTVLAGLAPSEAPIISGISVSNPVDNNLKDAKLSFSSTPANANMSNTSSVTPEGLSGPTSTLSNVLINEEYLNDQQLSNINQSEGVAAVDLRLGVVNTTSGFRDIEGIINDQVAADSASFTNHGANSFGTGEQGSLTLIVNGTVLHSQSLSGSFEPNNKFQTNNTAGTSINANGSGFINVSTTQSANFTGTGNSLDVFKHRSGSFVVDKLDQREGWNYAIVRHEIGGTINNTNYVTWVNASNNDALSDTTENIELATPKTTAKFMSGIGYITGDNALSGSYKAKVTNAYRDVYSKDTNAVSVDIASSVGADSFNFNDLILTGSKIAFSSSFTEPSVSGNSIDESMPHLDHTLTAPSSSTLEITASFRIENVSISPSNEFAATADNSTNYLEIDGSVVHPIKTNATLDTKTVTGLLYDNRQTLNSDISTKETFVSESFRLQITSSGVQYDSQTDVADAIGTYISSASLGDNGDGKDGLLIVPTGAGTAGDIHHTGGGSLVYPTRGLNSGNYTAINTQPVGVSNPSYASLTGNRHYLRAFTNGGGVQGTTSFTINGSDSTIVNFGIDGLNPTVTALNSSRIYVAAKLPGATGFLDVALSRPDNNSMAVDNTGCLIGSLDQTLTDSATNEIGFASPGGGGSAIGIGNHVVLRITYAQTFTGYINQIEFTDF